MCLIDGYGDLLLPGHRLFAQLQVFAPGEHFYRTNFQCCSTVVHRVTKHYNLQYDVQEMFINLTQCNCVWSRCRATMRHYNTLLKRILGAERTTGALAIVNHHTHRSGTYLAAISEVLIGTTAVQHFFPTKYRNPLQGRPGLESRPRVDIPRNIYTYAQ